MTKRVQILRPEAKTMEAICTSSYFALDELKFSRLSLTKINCRIEKNLNLKPSELVLWAVSLRMEHELRDLQGDYRANFSFSSPIYWNDSEDKHEFYIFEQIWIDQALWLTLILFYL